MIRKHKKKHVVPTPAERNRQRVPNHFCGEQKRWDYKTDTWVVNPNYMPPKRRKDNGIWGAVGRGYYHRGPGNTFCTGCNRVFSPAREARWVSRRSHAACPNCGSKALIGLDSEVRVPRLSANARVWANFRRMFVEPVVRAKLRDNPKWPEPKYTEAELEAQAAQRAQYDAEAAAEYLQFVESLNQND